MIDRTKKPNGCPQCGSKDIIGSAYSEFDGGYAQRCGTCFCRWDEIYSFTRYEIIIDGLVANQSLENVNKGEEPTTDAKSES